MSSQMNSRREAILRELNIYPLWQRRDQPAPVSRVEGGEAVTQLSAGITTQAPIAAQAPMGIAQPVLSKVEGLNPSYAGWDELKVAVKNCTLCKLRPGCTQTVFGVGDEKADWLFVGEGPGADEDALGEPFVGQAGKLLDSMLAAIKLKRGHNVYIANIVKCRPPGNREPEPEEIATCLPYLQRQIALLQPKLIVALGKTAATSLLGQDVTLNSLRGRLHEYQGVPLLITYHPAYLLRTPSDKAKAWQDLGLALETIQKH